MAIVLEQEPNNPSACYNQVKWVFTLDDLGTPPEEKYIKWRLYDVTNSRYITELAQRKPLSTSERIVLDFQKDLAGEVQTIIPNIGDTDTLGVTHDTSIIKIVRLDYGEFTFDTDTCEETGSLNVQSDPISVLNTALQPYELDFFNGATSKILSNRPRELTIIRDAVEFLWTWGTADVALAVSNIYDDSGTTPVVGLNINTDVVTMLPLTFSRPDLVTLGVDPDTVYKFETTITVDGQEITYTRYVEDVCDNYVGELMFLEPLGGRAIICAEQVESASATDEFKEISIFRDDDVSGGGLSQDNVSFATVGGTTIIDKKANDVISLRLFGLPKGRETIQYLHSLKASVGYHIVERYLDTDFKATQTRLRKFKLDAGSIQYVESDNDTIEVLVTGRYTDGINNQLMDR